MARVRITERMRQSARDYRATHPLSYDEIERRKREARDRKRAREQQGIVRR